MMLILRTVVLYKCDTWYHLLQFKKEEKYYSHNLPQRYDIIDTTAVPGTSTIVGLLWLYIKLDQQRRRTTHQQMIRFFSEGTRS